MEISAAAAATADDAAVALSPCLPWTCSTGGGVVVIIPSSFLSRGDLSSGSAVCISRSLKETCLLSVDGGCTLCSRVGLSVLRFECFDEGASCIPSCIASCIASSLMRSSSGASK